MTGGDGVDARWCRCDVLLVFFGLSPKLGPDRRLGPGASSASRSSSTPRSSRPTCRASSRWATSTPIPGKKKLILSGFHEAALAAFGAAPYIFPDKRIHLQYTTTSPKLHKVLGVETPVFD